MAIYDVNGSPIVASGSGSSVTVKKNNTDYVTEFLAVAQSYLNHTEIEYKDGNTPIWQKSGNGIDCSTFVGLCLMGYSYEKSPYVTGQSINPDTWKENSADYDWALPTIRYKISRFIDGSNPDENIRLACQIARWMAERGQEVPLTNGFRDVEPGDIVTWATRKQSTGEYSNPTWYRYISHIGIILSKEDAPNTFVDDDGQTRTWNKTKYPFKHQIIEVTLETPPCINTRWLERKQENEAYMWGSCVNTIAGIFRPDFGAMTPRTE